MILDPDCRDGKHRTCFGGPCECDCHKTISADLLTTTADGAPAAASGDARPPFTVP